MTKIKLCAFSIILTFCCTNTEKEDVFDHIYFESQMSESHIYYATFDLYRLNGLDKSIFTLYKVNIEDSFELDTLDYLYQKIWSGVLLSEKEFARLDSPKLNIDKYEIINSDTSYYKSIMMNTPHDNIKFDENEQFVYFIESDPDTFCPDTLFVMRVTNTECFDE